MVNREQPIKINSNKLTYSRHINSAYRIILSNAYPKIPHLLTEQYPKQMVLRIVSPMKFFRAGMHEQIYVHILSYSRQVFMSMDDKAEVASSIFIYHDYTTYRIFIFDAKMETFC